MKHQFALAQRRKGFQMYKNRFGKGKSFLRMAKENFYSLAIISAMKVESNTSKAKQRLPKSLSEAPMW